LDAPKITTAIPLRRYRLAGYSAVVLGDIESPDAGKYRYILAVVPDGETRPSAYVACTRAPRARSSNGSHVLRIVSDTLSEELGQSDAWDDVDAFANEGLKVVARVLGLGEVEPQREM